MDTFNEILEKSNPIPEEDILSAKALVQDVIVLDSDEISLSINFDSQ